MMVGFVSGREASGLIFDMSWGSIDTQQQNLQVISEEETSRILRGLRTAAGRSGLL